MDPDFWRQRWSEGRIGFHQGAPHGLLVRFADAVLGSPARVLVPLCGKAVDLAWLAARGSSVVGVELVEDAARAFFEEQQIPAQPTRDGPLVRWAGGSIEIVVGDFFEITHADVGGFDAVYDRAALVALPGDLRARYVAHLRTLLDPGARVLLVAFAHDAPKDDPPFSVEEPEVRALWDGCAIRALADDDLTDRSEALRARGATSVREQAWSIELPR